VSLKKKFYQLFPFPSPHPDPSISKCVIRRRLIAELERKIREKLVARMVDAGIYEGRCRVDRDRVRKTPIQVR
jgi:hypothetical protein